MHQCWEKRAVVKFWKGALLQEVQLRDAFTQVIPTPGFLPSNKFPDTISREVECDIEYVALDVDTSYISGFKDIPNKPGYMEVFLVSRQHKRKMEEVLEKINETIMPVY